MSARDRYIRIIECPNCAQKGTLDISEDDHPYVRDPHREIDGIDGDFTATVKRKHDIK